MPTNVSAAPPLHESSSAPSPPPVTCNQDDDRVPPFVADPLVAWIVDRTNDPYNNDKKTQKSLHTSNDNHHNVQGYTNEDDNHQYQHCQQHQGNINNNKPKEEEDSFFDVVLVAGFPMWTTPPRTNDHVDVYRNNMNENEQSLSHEEDYQRFLQLVQSCFDDEEGEEIMDAMDSPLGEETNDKGRMKNKKDPQQIPQGAPPSPLFLYQSQYLHVTIATLCPLRKKETYHPHPFENATEPHQHFQSIHEYFLTLLQRASQSTLWPTRAMEFVLVRAQLGTHAGILLWKDLTGGIEQIRMALRQAEEEELQQQRRRPNLVSWSSTPTTTNTARTTPTTPSPSPTPFFPIHSIPDIIHSTFLRFHSEPQTCARRVHERFAQEVLPKLHLPSTSLSLKGTPSSIPQQKKNDGRLFSNPIVVSKIHLVCERTPYMQFQKSSETVLATITLSSSSMSY